MNISSKVASALQVSARSYSDTGSAKQRVLKLHGLMLAALTLSGVGNVQAADVYLQAQSFDKTMPDESSVKMWGFAECTDNTYTDCVAATAPGPEIRVDLTVDTSLTINVQNTLPVPVSVIVPGQVSAGAVVSMTDGTGQRSRVRSFTHETAANSTGSYAISSLKAGTYLYQSGTVPQLQVPMGLYGALVVTDGTEPAVEALAVFSEIDPVQNSRVDAAATGGTILSENCVGLADYTANATTGYPCTIDYNPRHLLVNGGDGFNLAATQGGEVLLRWANAGMKTHTPSIIGLEQNVIAEDGNLYPGLPRRQSVVMLGAGVTKDAVVTMPASDITLSLFDRQPGFPNDSDMASDATETGPGASLGAITVGVGSTTTAAEKLAKDDEYSVDEDQILVINTGRGVLSNDDSSLKQPAKLLEVLSAPSHGTVIFNPANNAGNYSGRFTYTPDPNFSGVDQFTYQVGDGGTNVATAHVTLNVSYVNDTPSAQGDSYANTKGAGITVLAPGILANDIDLDGDQLRVGSYTNIAGLTLISDDGSFTYNGPGGVSFSYQACDQAGQCSDSVNVTLTTNPVSNIGLTVEDESGLTVTDYRWTVEEDATWYPDPTQPPSNDVLALNFHKSYMPVVAQGVGAAEFASLALDSTKRYYVTVLPANGAAENGSTTGAAQFKGSDSAVTVKVHTTPTEMAQISILIFNDNAPTNAAWDNGEAGLGGFVITLEDAGGRYGASAGILSYDAFNEPLTNSIDCFGSFGVDQDDNYLPGTYVSKAALPGIIQTCPDNAYTRSQGLVGQVLIKNLYPGKYGVITSPSADQATDWVQTSTIEGTKVVDAWVKAGEPAHFQEFGPPGWHVFTGFVNPAEINAAAPTGANNVTGQVTNAHMSRPPAQLIADSGNYDALSHTRAWLSVNSQAGIGPSVAVVQAEPDGSFTLPNLPDGNYQVAIWDSFMDQVIAYRSFTVPGTTDLGNIPVFNWFARLENTVFKDDGGTCGATSAFAQNGIFDEACGELAMPEQNVNLRWRDGTVYQAAATDGEGYVPFDTVFPFFHWLVAEVDYARFKPTGVTVAVDHGGEVSPASGGNGIYNPQQQDPADAANSSADPNVRTETGFVLTQGFQAFLGQTNVIEWGKVDWPVGENGGISGIVYYATTRAENDPRLGAAEPWEPGVAGATVRLYRKVTRPGVNAAEGDLLVEGDYTVTTDLSRLNNDTYRVQFGVMDLDQFVVLAEDYNSITRNNGTSSVRFSVPGNNTYIGAPIAVRVLINGNTRAALSTITFNESGLVLVNETSTDNFDASAPEGCPGAHPDDAEILGEQPGISTRCYDGIRNFNQVRPGVFDGGYAFNEDAEGNPLKPGKYVVEVVVPEGYEIVKEEDVNVGFGESYARVPVPLLYPTGGTAVVPDTATTFVSSQGDVGIAQPHCVGAPRTVPAYISLFPGMQEPAPFAGAIRPLCDRKEVQLVDQGQAAADFMVATHAPIAGHFTGMVLDDVATEFNARSPAFGEKWAPPYVPVAVRNAQGVEIGRVISDQYGRYNGLVPSTISSNLPSPSGISPTMLITCMNDPGPIPGPGGEMIIDPNFNPAYSNFCYTFQYMPGTTTYLDTPVLPVSAFASGYNPPDCAMPAATPEIKMVETDQGDGPLVRRSTNTVKHTVTLHSVGVTSVPNPAYQGPLDPNNEPKTIDRNYGFGTQGPLSTVMLDGTPLTVISWSDAAITVEAPIRNTTGQLLVTNAAGVTTENGVTLTVAGINENRVRRVPAEYGTIQDAIEAANPNDIVMVSPGVYNERLIMWKPVRLQGSGSGATILNGALLQTEALVGWRQQMDCLYGIGAGCNKVVDSLPNQDDGAAGFLSEEGATVTVVAPFDTGNGPGRPVNRFAGRNARIDGFAITGNSTGGAVFVNGYAHGLDITNNDVYGNSGGLHGGIRVGRPDLQLADPQTQVGANRYDFSRNVHISYNIVRQNGSIGVAGPGGAGAGVSVAAGTDNYRITDNYVCGNFSLGNGGGIGHFGLSDNGRIMRNSIVLNQTFDQAQNVSGGGVFIAGEPANGQALTYGAGDVIIGNNLIQGNQAGAGHGGGIRLQNINGADVVNTNNPNRMFKVTMRNNVIVNNVAGWSGAGVSIVDALRVDVLNNTIAHNDSTATVGGLINVTAGVNSSVAQPSGLVTELNSPAMNAAISAKTGGAWNSYKANQFSNPVISNNIIGRNRSFSYLADTNGARLVPELSPATVGECANGAVFWDTAVLETALSLTMTGTNTNPVFVDDYCNGERWGAGPMNVHPTVDEGGAAWIDVRYGPLDVRGDYSVAP